MAPKPLICLAVLPEGPMVSSSAKAFHYVQSFACLAEHCEDNCCQAWRISVSPQRVDDYTLHSPELLNLIVSDDQGFRMNQDANNQCVALQGGRCSIHAQAGEAALPDTCARYPRMERRFNQFAVQSATMSCPEVARLVLFGETPFLIEARAESTEPGAGDVGQHLAELDVDCWTSIARLFSELALSTHHSVEQIVMQLCRLASHVEHLPYDRWMEASASLTWTPALMPHQDPDITDQLLRVLIDILKAPNVPDRMRQRVLSAIDTHTSTATAERYHLALKPAIHEIARRHADADLAPTLKRFIAAEMTRTGFPFISTTPAGQDYGMSLSEWAATLAIRTLTLRLLLLAHCNETPTGQLTPQQIVDLTYRYCRSASHNPATASEATLRRTISTRAHCIHSSSGTQPRNHIVEPHG